MRVIHVIRVIIVRVLRVMDVMRAISVLRAMSVMRAMRAMHVCSVQLRQNRDHDLTSCAFRRAATATAAVSESRRALRVNDFFFIVGVIVLIIAKIISIMHDWCCNGSSAGVEVCRLLPYM